MVTTSLVGAAERNGSFSLAGHLGIASPMLRCSTCSRENPDGAKFCMECASPLDAASARPRAEERKVVTALFCDLVGFTALSESADPEDVDKMLADYFQMARSAIEAYGGTLEKFIGDAVVGVFGVPAAHEDDPERAVRAGLRVAEDAEALKGVGGVPLRLRIGINTGEALVESRGGARRPPTLNAIDGVSGLAVSACKTSLSLAQDRTKGVIT
jgi:Adenylate and Guanylate cyclase catalytic domain/zinc-ribbon domain